MIRYFKFQLVTGDGEPSGLFRHEQGKTPEWWNGREYVPDYSLYDNVDAGGSTSDAIRITEAEAKVLEERFAK